MFNRWRELTKSRKSEAQTFDQYVSKMPSHQNAIDAIPGWSTALPPECGVIAGNLATYADPRIAWALERFGPIADRQVLELGPLEAGHTIMLERAGANVDAVEANQLAFMRCLITKEIVGLTRSRFWLGDFMQWLENTDKTYDLIVASGVLYHLTTPLRTPRTDGAAVFGSLHLDASRARGTDAAGAHPSARPRRKDREA